MPIKIVCLDYHNWMLKTQVHATYVLQLTTVDIRYTKLLLSIRRPNHIVSVLLQEVS
jgi:hypothetical protein